MKRKENRNIHVLEKVCLYIDEENEMEDYFNVNRSFNALVTVY